MPGEEMTLTLGGEIRSDWMKVSLHGRGLQTKPLMVKAGWAAVILSDGNAEPEIVYGAHRVASNNQMELMDGHPWAGSG